MEQAPHVPVVPSRTIDCWSCDTPNTSSRMFCVSCGSFIAIGSKAKPPPQSEPFSGPPPVPGDADVDVSLPFVAGVSPLGSYSTEAQRRATRRTRTLTAVTSAALAIVIAGAALYLASPLSDRDGEPQTAVVAPTGVPEPTDRTGAVSGISLEPDAVTVPEMAAEPVFVAEPEPVDVPVAEPDPVAELEPIEELAVEPMPDIEPLAQPPAAEPEPIMETEPIVEPEPITEPQPDPIVAPEPVTDPEPIVEPAPEAASAIAPEPVEAAAEPDPIAGPVSEAADGIVEPAASVRTATLPAQEPAAYDGGWVCSEEVVIEDSRGRDWSISRVSFRIRDGFERVVLQLDRAGSGSGQPGTIKADSMGSWKVKENLPGTARPGLGRRAVTLQLGDGFSGSLGLRGYRPSGLDIIKEFSVYPGGRDGRTVVISADTGGCYRVRVPAWNDPSGSVRRAEIHVDIKP